MVKEYDDEENNVEGDGIKGYWGRGWGECGTDAPFSIHSQTSSHGG